MHDEWEGEGQPNGNTIGHLGFSVAMRTPSERKASWISSMFEGSQWLDPNLRDA